MILLWRTTRKEVNMKMVINLILATLLIMSPQLTKAELLIDPELKCLALNIYHESRGEPLDGQLKVGMVTVNRVKHDYYPDSLCEVVYQPKQFSWTEDPPPVKNKQLLAKIERDIALPIMLGIIEPIDNSIMFHSFPESGPNFFPYWYTSYKLTAVIGGHLFYQEL